MKLSRVMTGTVLASFIAAILAVFSSEADAQHSRYWLGELAHDGIYDWSDTGTWRWGVPAGNDTHIGWFGGSTSTGVWDDFDDGKIPDGSNFTVYLNDDLENYSFRARDGAYEMTLDVNGYTYTTVTQATAQSSGYVPYTDIQSGAGGGVTVSLISSSWGGVVNWPLLALAYAVSSDTSTGTLRVIGEAVTLNLTNADANDVGFRVGGHGKQGTLEVIEGATLNSVLHLRQAAGSSTTGILRIRDPGSTLTVTDAHMILGLDGTAEVTVEAGGVLRTVAVDPDPDIARYIHFAHNANASTTARIAGEGSRIESAGRVTLGGRDRVGGQAHVTVEDGGTLQSAHEMRVYGTTSTKGPSSLTLRGGRAVSGSYLRMYEGSSLSIDGPASTDAGLAPAVTTQSDFRLDANVTLSLTIYNAGDPALVSAGNNVPIAGGVVLNLQAGDGAEFDLDEFVELIAYGNSLTGDGVFANYSEGQEFSLASGHEFRFTYVGGEDSKTMGLHVIPEPGALALVFSGMGILAAARLKRLRR